MWLRGEERKGTHARFGIGLGRRVYVQVCPIYHELGKKKPMQTLTERHETDASLHLPGVFGKMKKLRERPSRLMGMRMMCEPETGPTQPSLLLRIRDASDEESWQTFVSIYAPLIYRSCRRRGLQDADAADVGQDVLAQVARSIRDFEYQPGRGRFRDWLGTIVRHKVCRFLRNEGRGGAGWSSRNPWRTWVLSKLTANGLRSFMPTS